MSEMPHRERTVQPEDLLAQLGWVQRLARNLAGDTNVAADVTQDVWLKTHGRGVEPGRMLRRWLGSLTRGLVHDSRREAGRRESRERAAARPEAQPSTSEVVERNAMQQRVSAAIGALDEPYRSTILHRYMDDLSTAQIAERMSVTEQTVRQRLVRARKTLKARLDREFGGVSGSWALAILGAVPAGRFAAATTSGAGTATAASTSTGFSAVLGVKVAAIGATVVLGAAVGWRELGPSEDPVSTQEPGRAAAATTYDWDEKELAAERTSGQQRRIVLPDDERPKSVAPQAEPDNEYMLAPLQMW